MTRGRVEGTVTLFCMFAWWEWLNSWLTVDPKQKYLYCISHTVLCMSSAYITPVLERTVNQIIYMKLDRKIENKCAMILKKLLVPSFLSFVDFSKVYMFKQGFCPLSSNFLVYLMQCSCSGSWYGMPTGLPSKIQSDLAFGMVRDYIYTQCGNSVSKRRPSVPMIDQPQDETWDLITTNRKSMFLSWHWDMETQNVQYC